MNFCYFDSFYTLQKIINLSGTMEMFLTVSQTSATKLALKTNNKRCQSMYVTT